MSYLKAKHFKENYGVEYGAVPKFEWVDDDSSFEEIQERRGWNQIKKKFKSDPLIPLGVFATIGALTYGLKAFKKGDSMLQNYMMRARVGFQAFTIAVFCFSSAGIMHALKEEKKLAKEKEEAAKSMGQEEKVENKVK